MRHLQIRPSRADAAKKSMHASRCAVHVRIATTRVRRQRRTLITCPLAVLYGVHRFRCHQRGLPRLAIDRGPRLRAPGRCHKCCRPDSYSGDPQKGRVQRDGLSDRRPGEGRPLTFSEAGERYWYPFAPLGLPFPAAPYRPGRPSFQFPGHLMGHRSPSSISGRFRARRPALIIASAALREALRAPFLVVWLKSWCMMRISIFHRK